MPTFLITAPDGRKLRVAAPEGAAQEQALAYAQERLGQQQKKSTLDRLKRDKAIRNPKRLTLLWKRRTPP